VSTTAASDQTPVGAPSDAGRTERSRVGLWLSRNRQSIGLVPAILIVVVIGSQTNDAFLTRGNVVSVLQASAVLGVLVVAESIVLIAGRFDLSLESTVGFAPMLAAWLLAPEALSGVGLVHSQIWAVPIVLAAGALVGALNGLAIVVVRLNAFMVTLAMLILLRGLTYAMTDGATISGPPSSMVFIGQKVILGVPIEIFLVIGLFIVAAVIMRYHRFGRAIYAIGGNEEAARAAGLRVNQRLLVAYVLAGLLSAVAGMILAGQVDAVTTQQGSGLIFTVFAAAVIGGISLNGGRGAMIGAGLGVLFLSLIGNVMTLAQVPSQVIDAVRGLVILAALLVNRFTFEDD
jgi:simple sugar transport system permease protein